jgi:hypothetical protein
MFSTSITGAMAPVATGITAAFGHAPWWATVSTCLVWIGASTALKAHNRQLLYRERMAAIRTGRRTDSAAMLNAITDDKSDP